MLADETPLATEPKTDYCGGFEEEVERSFQAQFQAVRAQRAPLVAELETKTRVALAKALAKDPFETISAETLAQQHPILSDDAGTVAPRLPHALRYLTDPWPSSKTKQ
jgi:hypothetical protein